MSDAPSRVWLAALDLDLYHPRPVWERKCINHSRIFVCSFLFFLVFHLSLSIYVWEPSISEGISISPDLLATSIHLTSDLSASN